MTGELPVSGTGGIAFFGAFVELVLKVDHVLCERCDPALQLVDVDWRPQSGLGPNLFAQNLREPLFQLPNASGQAVVALVRIGQIRLEGGPADCTACPSLRDGAATAPEAQLSQEGVRLRNHA
ncbi:hypothetical protein ACIGT4_31665 [Streptomyces sioyaensis]|uniref:hypothetical protein n=1 Tax=Streptomyces sioyaensis TaxID=67364 RepID=UPI0037CDFD52